MCHICIVPRGPLDHPAAGKEAASYVLQQNMQFERCLRISGMVWQGAIMCSGPLTLIHGDQLSLINVSSKQAASIRVYSWLLEGFSVSDTAHGSHLHKLLVPVQHLRHKVQQQVHLPLQGGLRHVQRSLWGARV